MGNSSAWAQLDPLTMIGGPTGGLSEDVTTGGLGASAVQSMSSVAHPDHPFFWFALIAGVTVGLIGASTHLRVGPFRAGIDAGDSR